MSYTEASKGWWERVIERLRSARPDPDDDGSGDVEDVDDAVDYRDAYRDNFHS
jgi:hypothetical protein